MYLWQVCSAFLISWKRGSNFTASKSSFELCSTATGGVLQVAAGSHMRFGIFWQIALADSLSIAAESCDRSDSNSIRTLKTASLRHSLKTESLEFVHSRSVAAQPRLRLIRCTFWWTACTWQRFGIWCFRWGVDSFKLLNPNDSDSSLHWSGQCSVLAWFQAASWISVRRFVVRCGTAPSEIFQTLCVSPLLRWTNLSVPRLCPFNLKRIQL